MNKILSKLLGLLKYVLLIAAFAITLFGIINTYKRLEKPITDAIPVFLPFAIIFILFVVNIFVKKARVGENLLFNFTSIILFSIIIIIGLRAKFDTNMLLYYKYKIGYNPLYFADNLSSIKIMLYCLSISNFFFILKSFFEPKEEKVVVTSGPIVKNDVKLEEEKPAIEPVVQKIVETSQKIEPIKEVIKTPIVEEKVMVEETKPVVEEL